MSNQDRVVIGRIMRPHGVAGELTVQPFTETATSFESFKQVVIQRAGRPDESYRVVEARPHKSSILLKLKGVVNRDQAQALAGGDVAVPREWLPQADEDEYYWTDLIGLRAVDPAGREVGRVENLLRTGPDDLLVLSGGAGEILLPFRVEFVREVDLAEGLIRIDPPEGLLEA